MNTRRNIDRRVGEKATGGNQGPQQAPVVKVQLPVNLAVLTNGEVREA